MRVATHKDETSATPALAGVADAGRRARRDLAGADDKGLNEVDISVIPVGYSLMAKFAYAARTQMVSAAQQEQDLQAKAKTKEQRELERLAAWDAQMTIVGGIRMTNAEAQIARRGVIDNADHYARWAVAQGRIRPGEKEEFEETARRKCDLEDKRRNGTITAAEEQEDRRISQSRRRRKSAPQGLRCSSVHRVIEIMTSRIPYNVDIQAWH